MTARQRIHAFLRTLSRRHRAFGVLHAVLPHALVWALVLLIVELALPGWLTVALIVAGAALVGVALLTWWRSRPGVASTDRELRLQDRLLTYLGLGESQHATPMADWLEHDLDDRLRALPPERAAGLWRRPLGWARYLIPILIVLVLVRLLAPALPPIQPRGPQANAGAGGGGPDQPDKDGEGSSDNDAPQDEQEEPEPSEEPTPPPLPTEQPEPPPEPSPEPQPEPQPKPLIEGLEEEEAFVVPDFVGDGESRRSKARVAVVPDGDGDGGGGSRAPDPAGGGGNDRPQTSPDFEKAREQALNARRVPEHEQPFVRRYFEALVRRDK